MQVTLVGLPAGVSYSTVRDSQLDITYEPNVTVEVDDPTVQERLKQLEPLGWSFLFGDPAALDVVAPVDVPVQPVPVAAPAASS